MNDLIKMVSELKTMVSKLADYVDDSKHEFLKSFIMAQNPELKNYDRHKDSSPPYNQES